MLAVVLAGGLGTRLRPLTDKIPKAMIPVQGRPLTEHILDILSHHGVTDVILSLRYLAGSIQSHFGDNWQGMNISYAIEKEPLGTAGPFHLIPPQDKPFLVLNGDNLSTLDLKAFMKFHEQKEDAIASIALVEVEDTSQFGVADLNGDLIERFIEKPKPKEAPSNWINAGYYVFSPKINSFLPDKGHSMLERDVFPRLAAEGLLYGFKGEGQWFPTDTPERYDRVKREWKGLR